MSISKKHLQNKRRKKGLDDDDLFFELVLLRCEIDDTADEYHKNNKIQRAKTIKEELMKRDNK